MTPPIVASPFLHATRTAVLRGFTVGAGSVVGAVWQCITADKGGEARSRAASPERGNTGRSHETLTQDRPIGVRVASPAAGTLGALSVDDGGCIGHEETTVPGSPYFTSKETHEQHELHGSRQGSAVHGLRRASAPPRRRDPQPRRRADGLGPSEEQDERPRGLTCAAGWGLRPSAWASASSRGWG